MLIKSVRFELVETHSSRIKDLQGKDLQGVSRRLS